MDSPTTQTQTQTQTPTPTDPSSSQQPTQGAAPGQPAAGGQPASAGAQTNDTQTSEVEALRQQLAALTKAKTQLEAELERGRVAKAEAELRSAGKLDELLAQRDKQLADLTANNERLAATVKQFEETQATSKIIDAIGSDLTGDKRELLALAYTTEAKAQGWTLPAEHEVQQIAAVRRAELARRYPTIFEAGRGQPRVGGGTTPAGQSPASQVLPGYSLSPTPFRRV